MFQKDFQRNTFLSFSIGHTKYFLMENFFEWIDFFHMNTRNFCLNFFNILKYVKNAFCIMGSSAPMSQNIMSVCSHVLSLFSVFFRFFVLSESYNCSFDPAFCEDKLIWVFFDFHLKWCPYVLFFHSTSPILLAVSLF